MRLTSCLPALLIATGTLAQSPPAAVTLSRHVQYWNPAWSPDGRTLLFEATLHGASDIYAINQDGTGLHRLTTDPAGSFQATWSPDGQRIVFSSDRGGHGDLYLMNADGSGQSRLTSMPSGSWYQSSFSPDGRWIVFQGRPDMAETRDRVFVIAVDGSGLRQLTDSTYSAEGPRWSSDGRTIRFLQVPYRRRLWREMREGDMPAARAAQRQMSIRADGSGLMPVDQAGKPEVPAGQPADAEPSPDRSMLAYSKSISGYAGLYVYDVASQTERLLTGGPGAGPLGYLRTAQLTAASDTFDTFTSLRTGGGRTPGDSFARVLRRIGAQRWELSDNWMDSSGRVQTRQTVRTGSGTLATEVETVRADRDSASLLVSPNRVTAWVVPEGASARLFDGPPAGERYASAIVVAAVAKTKPAIGAVFLAPSAGLFSTNPLVPVVDSIRVVARDTLESDGDRVPVVVLDRNAATRVWVDEATGSQVAARGNAGPQRYWWHVRRGIRMRDQ
jgi:hypothetical protein